MYLHKSVLNYNKYEFDKVPANKPTVFDCLYYDTKNCYVR